jgi:uncharacterized membrane protein
MASKASIAGHPVHPMLVAFPIGLWVTSFAVDVIFYFVRNPNLPLVSKIMIAAGLAGGVAAAVPGIIDWLTIKDPKVKKIADWHARLNIIAVIVFAASLYLRMRIGAPLVNWSMRIPVVLSALGVLLIGISGWLGGALVYEHGVAVAPQSNTREPGAGKATSD